MTLILGYKICWFAYLFKALKYRPMGEKVYEYAIFSDITVLSILPASAD